MTTHLPMFRMATLALTLASPPFDLSAQASPAPTSQQSTTLRTLADSMLHPEGIAWDARRQRWLVSSVRERKIIAVDASGERDLVTSGQDGLDAALAIALDPGRDLLWVASAALPQMQGFTSTDAGRSRLFAFELGTGRLRRRVELPGTGHKSAGDITVAPDGTVYASDGMSGALYRVETAGADTASLLVAPGQGLRSPQGIVLDGDRLLVADWSRGIHEVKLATGAVRPLEAPDPKALRGIDGFVRIGPRELLGIQNGASPARVLRLTLTDNGAGIAEVRVADQPALEAGEPTQGTVVDGAFVYIANSPWSNYTDDGTVRPGARWPRPLILRLPLR